jgi:predicted PurR-regulated permease PerM
MAGILLILVLHTMHVAKAVFLPIVLALLASFALTPIIRSLDRLRVPRMLSAALVVALLVVAGGFAVAALSSPAATWIERAPTTLREVERKLRPIRAPVERIAKATREVEEATSIDDGPSGEVRVKEPSLFSDLVLQTQGALATLAATLALLFFLLASRDGLARAASSAPRWNGGERRALELVAAIEGDVSRHLLTISLINLGLGICVGVALYVLGMPNPALWGAMATLLNFVPFLGAMVGVSVVTIVALISFDAVGRALATGLVFGVLTGLEGLVITPAVLGRRLTLSPVAVFVSILAWSWMWGVPGALVAVPVLAVTKIVCDRIEPLRPIGQLIGS